MDRFYNHLRNQKSPYLLQHAYNPVDWYPWAEEAFDKARREGKPIFLSIGYSTCHWCHVMAKESFEDREVAKLLNDKFVSIKVDREERPDIDSLYMNLCLLTTGSGGWPLTILMSPDKKPFFVTTYLPKESTFGRSGFVDLLTYIAKLWGTNRQKLTETAQHITQSLLDYNGKRTRGVELTKAVFDEAFIQLVDNFDNINGGFGTQPKFPTPHNILFLLRYWKRTGTKRALEMSEKTLQHMRWGGIYDHIGFGFHRYSTDASWVIPHFEKMLYDQALISLAYIEAYQATGKAEYKKTVEEIFEYVLRNLTHQGGGFYSAEDADSDGEEGKFYIWTAHELQRVLDGSFILIDKTYNISAQGNYRDREEQTGQNILYMNERPQELAANLNMDQGEFLSSLEKARHTLFDVREQRVHPAKDDKILTDWNGLMIAAFSKAAQAFDDPTYLDPAIRAVDFILKNLVVDGMLRHRFRDGEAAIPGSVDDYAFFIFGLIELYEATFSTKYLSHSIKLQDYMLEHFWDTEKGGFFFTADNSEQLLIRQKELRDGAIPSGNSIGLLNLVRLARLTGNTDFEDKATQIIKAFSSEITAMPSNNPMFLTALDFLIGPSYEIVVTGTPHSSDTENMLKILKTDFMPNKVLLFKATNDRDLEQLANFTVDMKPLDQKTTAYVCKNFTCNTPTTDLNTLRTLIENPP